jgi:hypothetical protein
MDKEFVSYNLALRLKALDFDEPCFGFYQKEYVENIPFMVDDDDQYRLTGYRTCENSEIPEHYTSAPTFSQAFRWFREKYNLHVNKTGNSNYTSFNMVEPKIEVLSFVRYTDTKNHYEEAELECLKKLIEIVENKEKYENFI